MAGSQKVFLRIFAIVGDGDDPDDMPDRVPVSGSGRLIPTLATGSGDIAPGPDSLHEVRLIEPIPFLIIDGMLTYDGKPYIWLPVPTGQWQWRIAFDTVRVGDQSRSLREYTFPLTSATPAQVADPGYPGVNIAQYATGAWEPGTVNLTADAIQQINIYLGRASNSAIAAGEHADRAEAAIGQIDEDADRAEEARDRALTARDEAVAARGVAVTKAGEASASAEAAATAQGAAEVARATSVAKAGEASDSAAAALTAKGDAESARATSVAKAGEASDSAAAALTAKDAAEAARATSVTKADEASDSAAAATTAKDAAEAARATSVTKAGEASDSAAAAQVLHDDVAAAVAQFDVDFAADMALFTGIRDDINLVANEVANDANRAEDAAQATEDALTVVRAHRWVPQGVWEGDLDYSAGDVVVHDGGSYYAQEDIPAGTEPPGGDWMMLGVGGITDAAELTGALTEYVDSSRTVIDLGSYVPGVEPEFKVTQLVAILGHLYLSLESSVEASRVTGALTGQVDLGDAQLNIPGIAAGPLRVTFEQFGQMLIQLATDLASKADTGHTHTIGDTDGLQDALDATTDASRLTGALTDQVDASNVVFSLEGLFGGSEPTNLFYAFSSFADLMDGYFAPIGHTHTTGDVDGLQAALDERPTRAEVESRTPPVVHVSELPANPDPGTLYVVVPS